MPRKEKVTSEEKIRTASACIEGKISVLGAADRLGVHASVVDDWIRLYQTEGIEAFLPRDRNRRYDPVLKEAGSGIIFWERAVSEQFAENIKFVIQSNSEPGLRCIMVIRISRNRLEEAV